MKQFFALLLFALTTALFFITPLPAFAQDLPTITILNPIRGNELGHENENLLPGLQAQWNATHKLGANATWLWQYSALENTSLVNFAKSQMTGQEFGLFLEIDRNFTNKSGVQYRGRGPWYFSDGLLLVSYDKSERHKLIDTAFSKFKATFGYYPKTVGAWWIGADSLTYMQQKYGITSAMKAADQYGVDVYTIWGSPWGIPYVASKENESIPAQSLKDSSKVVIMQWAARDPLRAYSSDPKNGLYSTQDFESLGLGVDYFDYLSNIYLKHPLDQILIGIENSHPVSFEDNFHYATVLREAVRLQNEGKVHIALAKDFASDFLAKAITLAPTHTFITKDFTSNDQAFWAMTSQYRISIQKRGDNLYLVDLRNYAVKSPEAFFDMPNAQGELRVNTPALIDSATFPEQKEFLGKESGDLRTVEQDGQTMLYSGAIKVATLNSNNIIIFKHSSAQNSFIFSDSSKTYPQLFFVLLIIYLAYSCVALLTTKNKKAVAIQCVLLFIPLLLSYPFLQSNTYLFDKKQLMLSYALFPFVPLGIKLALFQTIPLLLLLVIHYVSLKIKKRLLFFASLVLLTILYLHVPYFPLDRSTYKIVGAIIGAILVAAIATGTILSIRTKSKRIAIYSLISIVVLFISIGVTIFFSRSKEILVPFEMDALQIVATKHTTVLYLDTRDTPIYKAVRPILFDDNSFGGRVTDTTWKRITRDNKNALSMPNESHVLLFVPRYLGSYIYPEEIEKYHLKKIFDNQEIALFETNR